MKTPEEYIKAEYERSTGQPCFDLTKVTDKMVFTAFEEFAKECKQSINQHLLIVNSIPEGWQEYDSENDKGLIGYDINEHKLIQYISPYGWIKVKDRLPELHNEVIVYSKNVLFQGYHLAILNEKCQWKCTCASDEIIGVTDWQPIPQKPIYD